MIEVMVPEMGESITEAVIAVWHKAEGDIVQEDDVLGELETDKVTLEITALASGQLSKIIRQKGDTVNVGEAIALIDPSVQGEKEVGSSKEKVLQPSEVSKKEPVSSEEFRDANAKLPPASRRIIEEHKIDPANVKGSGKREQVLKKDVQSYLESKSKSEVPSASVESRLPSSTDDQTREREVIVPMSRLRQSISNRLLGAQQNAAILTTFNEIDMSNLMELRNSYKDSFLKKHSVKLGFMSFFTKACTYALKEVPVVNAEIRMGDGGTSDIVYKNYYDIGVAVGGPKGLLVPVIRSAETLSFAGIEKEIAHLATKVQNGKISLSDLNGGTFTITNGGIYGSMMSTPILNPPQSGILGMHNIVKRAVVVDDTIVIRPMMYVALSYDHRIIDGKEAVTFLRLVKEQIEDPSRLLLEV